MKSMIRNHLKRLGLQTQFSYFVIANTFAAAANITTKFVVAFALSDAAAVFLGFLVGLSTSYLLCKNFVFHARQGDQISQILRFTAVNLIALAFTYFTYRQVLAAMHDLAGLSQEDRRAQTAAHAIGVAAPVIFSFLAQKTFTFHQPLR